MSKLAERKLAQVLHGFANEGPFSIIGFLPSCGASGYVELLHYLRGNSVMAQVSNST